MRQFGPRTPFTPLQVIRQTKCSSLLAITLFLLSTAGLSHAAGEYRGNADMLALVNEVVKEHQLDRRATLALLEGAERKQAILDAIARPAEKTLTWAQYRPRFIDANRIAQAITFRDTYAEALNRAEAIYGVPPEIIVAIIGVETRFGRNKGSWRVVDALSTLAFDYPPRAKFFREQLKEFLRLERSAHISLSNATGSYAGAMGFPQFMPSSYRHFAIDFDNDGIIDLINNPVDAIGSVANYFKAHGWKQGAPVAARAAVTGDQYDDVVNQGLKAKYTVEEIEKAGLTLLSCREDAAWAIEYCADPTPDEKASAWKLEGPRGAEFWLGLHNFYVITRYNHSEKYSLTVLQLSRELLKASTPRLNAAHAQ